jgi:cytochrome oxidase Cu insertion factor (SCO1/SenC/PrrC family)
VDAGASSPIPTRSRTTARVATVIAMATLVGVGGGIAAHFLVSRGTATRIPLPELHGQATWAAGARQAPGFTLPDVLGGRASLASARGRVVLVTFLDSRCRTLCPLIGRAIGDVQRSLPAAARPIVFVVSVDPKGDSAASVRAAARRWSLAPGWRWLSGSRRQLDAVWRSYGIVVRPTTNDIVHGAAVYLIDRRGDERAGYLAPLLPNFLALDIKRVAKEPA